jgi:hypothetical protein
VQLGLFPRAGVYCWQISLWEQPNDAGKLSLGVEAGTDTEVRITRVCGLPFVFQSDRYNSVA